MDIKPVFPTNPEINQTNYYWFEQGFSNEEVNKIIKLSKKHEFQKATIIGDDKEDSIRKSNIKWLPVNEDWNWVYDRILNQIVEANKMLWDFNLHTIVDTIQYTEY
jgi:hypothetical protein